MDEVDTFRIKRHTEDTISIAPSTAESVIVEGEDVCFSFFFRVLDPDLSSATHFFYYLRLLELLNEAQI